jgi:hypothetical protein
MAVKENGVYRLKAVKNASDSVYVGTEVQVRGIDPRNTFRTDAEKDTKPWYQVSPLSNLRYVIGHVTEDDLE